MMTAVKIKQGNREAVITDTRVNEAGKLFYKVTWADRVTMATWATGEELYNSNPVEVVNNAIAAYHKRPAWEGEFNAVVRLIVAAELLQAPAVVEPEPVQIVPAYRPAWVVNPYSIVVYQGATAA